MLTLPDKIHRQIGHNLIFFGDDGLSMSEANAVAGKAGDIADTVGRLLNQTGSYVKTTELDGKIVTLVHPKKIENLVEVAKKDGELYGLKAYLMEAIKAKNSIVDYLKTAEQEIFAEENEKIHAYDQTEDLYPERKTVNENTVLQKWSLEERAEYYLLEAQVAHLGKKVHPNGILDRLAQESFEGVRYEREELNSGQGGTKTHIAEVSSLYTPDEAQSAFYNLHDARRELEKRLNWYKARLQNELNAQQIEAEAEFQSKLNDYAELQKKKREADEQLRSALQSRRLNFVREASDLKILVPDALRGIYDFVVNFNGRLV
ncbi:MAG: hypothetical protein H0U50_00790 [Pyrinomonadaceae bacterium]|nr:hypothetical protein [Pyrinomonadaceae bacterium]